MKTLLLDLETAPNLAYVWGLWNENVNIDRIVNSGYVLCWSAKWLGEREVLFSSLAQDGQKKMVRRIHALVTAADATVQFNGDKFDLPTLNKEFVLQGLAPPPPTHSIDLYKVVKKRFRFPSNKLDYVAQALGLGKKVRHSGFELWVRCMATDPFDEAAWEEMRRYNVHDVRLLERLYDRLLPWIRNHPNYGLHNDADRPVCINCGSERLQRRGVATTGVGRYARYQCVDCGTWQRGRTTTLTREKSAVVLTAVK